MPSDDRGGVVQLEKLIPVSVRRSDDGKLLCATPLNWQQGKLYFFQNTFFKNYFTFVRMYLNDFLAVAGFFQIKCCHSKNGPSVEG